jgi:hypothetical protein
LANEGQFARLKPLLPNDTRGKTRVDDRRVISGIIQVLKSGGRWIDAPCQISLKSPDDGQRRDLRIANSKEPGDSIEVC